MDKSEIRVERQRWQKIKAEIDSTRNLVEQTRMQEQRNKEHDISMRGWQNNQAHQFQVIGPRGVDPGLEKAYMKQI